MTGHLSKPDDWKKFPKKVVEQATKIEMEHTSNPITARRIGSDHLVEFGPVYYKELMKMEKKLDKQREKKKK